MSAGLLTGITTGVSMGGDVLQGIYAQRAANLQAEAMRSQISLVRAESEADIVRYAEQAKEFKTKQALAYMKSGVLLSGSPLDILDETVRVSSENISAMRAKAEARISGIRSGASNLEAQGRAALVGGIGKAAKTALSQYSTVKGGAKPQRTTSPTTKTYRAKDDGLGFGTWAGE